jgi:hypothetical protein
LAWLYAPGSIVLDTVGTPGSLSEAIGPEAPAVHSTPARNTIHTDLLQLQAFFRRSAWAFYLYLCTSRVLVVKTKDTGHEEALLLRLCTKIKHHYDKASSLMTCTLGIYNPIESEKSRGVVQHVRHKTIVCVPPCPCLSKRVPVLLLIFGRMRHISKQTTQTYAQDKAMLRTHDAAPKMI